MPPAIVAVVAAVATFTVQTFVTSAILSAILTLAISLAANALMRKPKDRLLNQGQEISLKLDPTMPRQVAVGQTATGGSLVWAFTYTDTSQKPNRFLVRIIQLSDLPINGVVQVREGSDILTFTGGDIHTGVIACDQHRKKDGSAAMWLRVYKGSPTAVADADLITWSAGQWTASHKGTNLAYAIVKYDNDPDAFPSGEPQLSFVVNGASLYDDRYDSSNGYGSGSQRLNDPSTWAFTRNSAVITSNILRGIVSAGVLIYGVQAEARDLDIPMLISAYNICDQTVTTASGTQPRYRAGMMLNSAEPTSSALLDMQASFDGRIIDRGGAITLRPGSAKTPVFHLTDDDIIWTEQKSWQPRATLSELNNHIVGTYIDGENGFSEKAFPTLRNAAWETEDGGERFSQQYSFRAITDGAQVQYITKRVHDASRYQGTLAVVLPIARMELEQGDWFTMTSERLGFTNLYFEAAAVDIVATDKLALAVVGKQVSPSFSEWSYVDEVPRGDTYWNSPGYDLVIPSQALSPYYYLDSTSLTETFGIAVTISGMPQGVLGSFIEVEYALGTGSGPSFVPTTSFRAGTTSASNQIYNVTGLKSGTLYGVRIRTTDGMRYSNWTAWATQTTTTADPRVKAAVDAVNDPTHGLAAVEASAAAAMALVADVSLNGAGSINPNPYFTAWGTASSPPDTWASWTVEAGTSRARVNGTVGKYAVQETVTTPTSRIGIMQRGTAVSDLAVCGKGYYVVEAVIKLVSGTLKGSGFLFQQTNAADTITYSGPSEQFTTWVSSDNVAPGNGVVGRTYRFSKLVYFSEATAQNGNLYALTNWEGWGAGQLSAKVLEWHQLSVRAATQAEIDGLLVFTPLSSTVSTHTGQISTNALAIATLDQKVTAGNPNLIPNGGFEKGFTGWSGSGSVWTVEKNGWGTFARSYYGGANLPNGFDYIYTNLIRIDAAFQLTLSVDLECYHNAGGWSRHYLQIDCYNNSNTYLGSSYGPAIFGPMGFSSTGANRQALKFTTGVNGSTATFAGTTQVRVILVSEVNNVWIINWRQAKLEVGNQATPYTAEASAGLVAGAVTTIEGKTTAYLTLQAAAGTSAAAVRLAADGYSGSMLELQADAIRLGSSLLPAMDISGGNVYFRGLLTANSIDVGVLKANSVVTSNLTVGNVSTEKLATEAVTRTVVATNMGNYSGNSTWTSIVNATITSEGYPIIVQVSFRSNTRTFGAQVRVLCNGGLVYGEWDLSISTGDILGFQSFSFVWTPGAGSNNFDVQFRDSSSPADVASARVLILTELKR